MLPWPARSPDLLPIENVRWKLRPAATTVDSEGQLRQLWQDIPQENIRRVFASTPDLSPPASVLRVVQHHTTCVFPAAVSCPWMVSCDTRAVLADGRTMKLSSMVMVFRARSEPYRRLYGHTSSHSTQRRLSVYADMSPPPPFPGGWTEVSMEQRRNSRAGETGDPRENPSTSGIIQPDSHMRESGCSPTVNRTRFAFSTHYTTAALLGYKWPIAGPTSGLPTVGPQDVVNLWQAGSNKPHPLRTPSLRVVRSGPITAVIKANAGVPAVINSDGVSGVGDSGKVSGLNRLSSVMSFEACLSNVCDLCSRNKQLFHICTIIALLAATAIDRARLFGASVSTTARGDDGMQDSPDFNIFENLWSVLEQRIRCRCHLPSPLTDLSKDSGGPVADVGAEDKEASNIGIGVLGLSDEKFDDSIEDFVGLTAEEVDSTVPI
ncbi:hypothetical protein PR048_022054 [Dryococelus australis]|uniref:Uncharacterized protein n=1 Tax=Dryococelus australis TaxID=614101 RepID=A0ABQ9GZZ8_9NEOP|nr:hypothetical protein PR048_022054 [Dryococelus australis]